jgi:dipeptidyl aminopeptidase/acylaminoacyl peptidase
MPPPLVSESLHKIVPIKCSIIPTQIFHMHRFARSTARTGSFFPLTNKTRPFMRHLVFILFVYVLNSVSAQDNTPYQQPPALIRDLLLASPTPSVLVGKTGEWMLILERRGYPDLAELAEPEVRIGGLRMNPANFSPSRTGGIHKITLRNLKTKTDYTVKGLPEKLRAVNVLWCPDESRFAFAQLNPTQVDLYVVTVATQVAEKINTRPLSLLPAGSFGWAGNDKLVYKTVPDNRGKMPVINPVPAGPVIQENLGKAGASRTYQDLIRNAYEEELFTYLTTSQLVWNDLKSEQPVGSPAIYRSHAVSPDNNLILATTIDKPFSYLVPYTGFPHTVSVFNMKGEQVNILARNPSTEGAPIGFDDVPVFSRNFQWRDDEPATIVFVTALDSGKGKSKSTYRDAVYATKPPLKMAPVELFRTHMRFENIIWGDQETALVYESMFATRRERISVFNPASGKLDSLYERSSNDAYNDIGQALTRKNQFGRETLILLNGREIILHAQGSSPEGDLPLIQTLHLGSGKRTQLWRCQAPYYERAVTVVDPGALVFLTLRESITETPNYFLRDLKKKSAIGTPVTNFTNPYPALEGISKEKIAYKRGDGISLTGNLYLPKGYQPGKDAPLPVLIWAYPVEYKSAADAAQVRGSKYGFTRLNWGSPIYWVTQGYAVLDNAEMPIVGEGDKEPNDNFIPQLYLNAHAAIQELARRGVGDSTRVGVGGHSYGAFMTANLLAHTNLFKAGIARSGAYNRTLTPFGFQAEERTYWQAPEVYYNMSPFSFANHIKTPILLIHGEMDNNPGTFPIQSERFYNAIKGHGGTVRYVVLPYESHGYSARENLLHMLWEQHQWLEKYVKKTAN